MSGWKDELLKSSGVSMQMGIEGELIVVRFTKEVRYLGFYSSHAREIAAKLNDLADRTETRQ